MSDELELLNRSLKIYLKPISKIVITVVLPEKNIVGKTISNWEVTETLKKKIAPESFVSLKVSSSSLTKILLEAETNSLKEQKTLIKILNGSWIKLSGFTDKFPLVAYAFRVKVPTKNQIQALFNNNQEFDTSVPGERGDTVCISEIPVGWFKIDDSLEKKLKETFEKYGKISRVVVPILDPLEDKINSVLTADSNLQSNSFRKSSFVSRGLYLTVYIQYANEEFCYSCLEGLTGKKLIQISNDHENFCNIKVEIDKTKRTSSNTISTRNKIRESLKEIEPLILETEMASTSDVAQIDDKIEDDKVNLVDNCVNGKSSKIHHKKRRGTPTKVATHTTNRSHSSPHKNESPTRHHEIIRECRRYVAYELLKKMKSKIKRELNHSSRVGKHHTSHSRHHRR